MKTIGFQLMLALALLTGVVIGYFAGGHSEPEAVAESPKKSAHGKIPDKGDAASLEALRQQVAELKRLLAEKGTVSEGAVSNAVPEAVRVAPPGERRPMGNPREWMENLRKTDPARFTQMTNGFARWQQRRAAQARSRMEFLSSVDTSRMSAGAKKTHSELQDLIVRREELEEQIRQEDISEDQRHQLFGEMRELDREMARLNGQERSNLIGEVVRELGFGDQEAVSVASAIEEVVNATGGGRGGGFGGPPGPPPGE